MRQTAAGSRRRQLLAGFCLVLIGTLGCATDDLGPGGDVEGFTVWIAQSVSGVVRHHLTGAPIPGATVTMTVGFELDQLFPFGTTTTSSTGAYSFVRAKETGVAGDFWFFVVGDTQPRTVYIQLEVRHGDYLPSFPRLKLSRTPTKNPPTTSLSAYSVLINAPMIPAPTE